MLYWVLSIFTSRDKLINHQMEVLIQMLSVSFNVHTNKLYHINFWSETLREHLCSCLHSSILASVSSTEDYGLLKKGRGLGRPENGMECKSCSRPLVDNENSPQPFRPDKSIAVPLSFPSAYLCLTICRSRARTMARIC